MLFKFFTSFILFLLVIPYSFPQFTGGNQDGYSNALLTQIGCPSLSPNYMFLGGNNDGIGNGSLIQSSCSPIIPNTYYGGNNDGFGYGSLTQSSCLTLIPNNTYYGGNNDGAGYGVLIQSSCIPGITSLFLGGNNDGYGYGVLTQSVCLNYSANYMFYGGKNDGYSNGTVTQSTCNTYATPYIFYGGKNDGFSKGLITQSTCTPFSANYMYYGGKNDGFGKSIIEQTLCSGITPLPIELLSFSAFKNIKGILLKWQTASEINNDYFTVEKSSDGINFLKLAILDGAGNSNSILNYSTIDVDPYKSITYYRLKQTDYDGKFKYSNIISINSDDLEDQNIHIFPNPNTGIFYIQGIEKESVILIQNFIGEIILTFKVDTITSEINLSNQPDGIYFVCLKNEKGAVIKKVVINK